MTGTVQIARTQAEIDFLDGLLPHVQSPILDHVVAADPFDQAPVLSMDAPDVCENVL